MYVLDIFQDWFWNSIINGIQNMIDGVIDWCCGSMFGIVGIVFLLYFLKRRKNEIS